MEEKYINLERISNLEKIGGKQFVQKIVNSFHRNVSQKIESAKEGVRSGNLEAVERAAHSIKSSAGNLGAARLEEISGNIEKIAESNEDINYDELILKLENAYNEIKPELNRILEEFRG